jgi:bacteriorhodopsin
MAVELKQSKNTSTFVKDEEWPTSNSVFKHIAISLFGAREAPYTLLVFYSVGFLISFILTSVLPTTDACATSDLAKSTQSFALPYIVFGMATCGALLRAIEVIGFISEDGSFFSRKIPSEEAEKGQLTLKGRSTTFKLVIAASFLVFAMQSLTYASISFDFGIKFCAPTYLIGDAPRIVFPIRFAYWSFSNPLIVIAVAEIVGAPPWQQLGASLITCLVCLFGLGMEYYRPTSSEWIILLFFSLFCSTLIEVISFIVLKRALSVASKLVDIGNRKNMRILLIGLGVGVFISWNAFPVVFLAAQLGGMSANIAEGIATPLLDGIAKIALCSLCTTLADIFSIADSKAKAKVDSLRLIENAKAIGDKERRLALMNFALELRVSISATAGATADVYNELQSFRSLLDSPSNSSITPSAILSKASMTAMEAVSSATTLVSVLDDFLGKEGINSSSSIRESGDSVSKNQEKKNTNEDMSATPTSLLSSSSTPSSSSSPSTLSVTSSEGFFDLTRLKVDRISVSEFFVSRICSQSSPLGQVALRKGITISSGLGRAVPVNIVSDEARISFVLTILLQKCINTCPRGGKISCRVSSIGWGLVPLAETANGPSNSKPVPFIKFSFQDDGLGLEKYEMDKVLNSSADGEEDNDSGLGVRRQATIKISSVAPAPQPPIEIVADKGGASDKVKGNKETDPEKEHVNDVYSMSLCRAAAGVLGGSVTVVSQSGSGTQFSLKIPAFSSMETLMKAMT